MFPPPNSTHRPGCTPRRYSFLLSIVLSIKACGLLKQSRQRCAGCANHPRVFADLTCRMRPFAASDRCLISVRSVVRVNFRLRLCHPLLSAGSNSASFSHRPHQSRMRCLEHGSAAFPGAGNTQASPSPSRTRLAARSAPAATEERGVT